MFIFNCDVVKNDVCVTISNFEGGKNARLKKLCLIIGWPTFLDYLQLSLPSSPLHSIPVCHLVIQTCCILDKSECVFACTQYWPEISSVTRKN